ncbi:MAG: hypothetical protein E6K72_00510 [Candidatus Eisenbacteria bacterium]|uniref:Uncharacterized protein n=1 Tax=Eiseniibacteriota bacterium TaxID=2212470 RepID=A0A538TAF7_UNCEI|nr:MAG: hypothetical protein E6K72_00510 [Candidatus Eisenbacteria bacterium]
MRLWLSPARTSRSANHPGIASSSPASTSWAESLRLRDGGSAPSSRRASPSATGWSPPARHAAALAHAKPSRIDFNPIPRSALKIRTAIPAKTAAVATGTTHASAR